MAVLDFSDGLQQPSAFGLSQAPQTQTQTPVPATITTAQTTPTTGAGAPATSTTATTATAPTACGITNLSACFSGDNFIAGALGFLLIAAGLFLFRPVRNAVVAGVKTAAVAA